MLLDLARRLDIPATDCVNTTSDHWSFEQAGMRAAQLGGTDYPQYHSPADLPRVVRPIQLRRTGVLIWQWLGNRPVSPCGAGVWHRLPSRRTAIGCSA